MLIFSHSSASVKKYTLDTPLPCGGEEGRPQSLAVTGDLSEDQIACTHAPFITLRMQRSMRESLGLAYIFLKGSIERCLLNSNYSAIVAGGNIAMCSWLDISIMSIPPFHYSTICIPLFLLIQCSSGILKSRSHSLHKNNCISLLVRPHAS